MCVSDIANKMEIKFKKKEERWILIFWSIIFLLLLYPHNIKYTRKRNCF